MTKDLALTVQTLTPRMEALSPIGEAFHRNVNVLLAEVQKEPKLSACSKTSFAKVCMAVAALGLDPSPEKQLIYLIPRSGALTIQVSYKGLMAIAKRNGAKTIVANVVRKSEVEGGTFLYELQPVPSITHRGTLATGEVVGAYCVVEMTDGARHQVVIGRDEIDAARKCAHGGGKMGPWKDHFSAMARKTAVRTLLRSGSVPLSEDMARGLSMDEDEVSEPVVIDVNDRTREALID